MRRSFAFATQAYGAVALDVYLLPVTPWEDCLALQRRLVFDLAEHPRRRAALILCEHPTILTVGRHGSHRHIGIEPEELAARRIEVRWTNRGGGCWFQTPGQLAAYPIVPLEPLGRAIEPYRAGLYQTILDVLYEFKIAAERDRDAPGVVIGGLEIASIGLAIKDWVAYHGCRLNVSVPLDLLNAVRPNPWSGRGMTSMFRELRTPVRIDAVRESFLRHFQRVFGFEKLYLNHECPDGLVARRTVNVGPGGH